MSLPRDCPISPAPRRRRKPEAKVQKEIAAWLVSRGAVVAITDAGMLSKLGMNMDCGIPRGWPDITCCLPGGRFLGIECKAAKGRQSDAQKFVQSRVEAVGGLYVVAHSLGECIGMLQLALDS